VEDGAERFETDGGGCGFVVVDSIPLCKALGNIADFVSYDVASIVAFAFAYEFAL
jgi:hypothetical protein